MAGNDHDVKVETPIDHNFNLQRNPKVERWEQAQPEEYWDYRREWENNPVERVLNEFPIHLDIEATNVCNLECTMCPRTDMVASGTFWKIGQVDFDFFKRTIDEGVRKGLRSVKFNYYGEPTLHKRLLDMVRYAKDAGIVDVMFNTNATTLTEEYAHRILESGLDKLFFSFDSPNREHYQAIRIGADYDEVLGNIKRFMRIRNEQGKIAPFTRVTMVKMNENIEECEEFKAMFEQIVDAVAFADYLDHGDQNNPDLTLAPVGSRKTKFCCPQLWQRLFVHPDGACTVCCMDARRTMIVGNAFEQTIPEIWLGEEHQRIRNLHAQGRIEELPTCARCPLASY